MGADNYTVKEMVTELRKENKLGISTQAIILTKIENMETQMKEIIAQNAIRN